MSKQSILKFIKNKLIFQIAKNKLIKLFETIFILMFDI